MQSGIEQYKRIPSEDMSTENRNMPVSNDYILRHSSDRYAAICDYLQELGFRDIAFKANRIH